MAAKKTKAKARKSPRVTAVKKTTKKAAGAKRALIENVDSSLPASGPVTLDEAKALASMKRPALAARALETPAAPPASPAQLGKERQRLAKERREERKRRIDDYKATMTIMKRRGARQPRSAATRGKRGGAILGDDDGFQPLQIFAEGDSWFDYPVPFFGGSIIPRLESRLGVPILNLAKAGDETRFMLGVEERQVLSHQFMAGCPAGGAWDALLFSGGGNDIVGNPMALWVKDWNSALPPASQIRQSHFDAALALVNAAYEELIDMRDQLSPDTHLIFHGYDFAIPDGRGVCFLGPWLKPTFDLRRFPSMGAGAEVVKVMLKQFAAMLNKLASRPKVTLIATQGTLAPVPASWHNELHPAKAGFETFADIFHAKLKLMFPDRVA